MLNNAVYKVEEIERLKNLQDENRLTELMVLQEEMKTMPFGDVWEEYCVREGVPTEFELEKAIFDEITYIQKYGVTEEELNTAKKMIEQETYYSRESTSNISSELENHLYFELIINGECVNPENYYDKSINEL